MEARVSIILLPALLAAVNSQEYHCGACHCNPRFTFEQAPHTGTLGTHENAAPSCEHVARSNPNGLPSYQWITNSTDDKVFVYCTAGTQCCNQGDVGWMRVANFDMSDPNQECRHGFKLFSTATRSCGRTQTSGGCQSMHFSTQGVEYSKVCGRVIAYQFGTPSGFYNPRLPNDIDNAYVEGVSITHGSSPRKHIWSFANGLMSVEGYSDNRHMCPCSSPNSRMQHYIPSFVGNNYFCDSGDHSTGVALSTYSSDPLWNGHGCSGQDSCCTFNNPPWFCKQLPDSTTDDIEARICADEAASNEDSPVRLIELYVK